MEYFIPLKMYNKDSNFEFIIHFFRTLFFLQGHIIDIFIAMQTFYKVAELESFSQAAQALNLPNATVSTRVSQLEGRLGVKLFNRTTRQVKLTDEGFAYLNWVKRILGEFEEVEDQLQGRIKQPHGRIRVDVPASIGRHIITPALPEFLNQYPGVSVELGCSDRVIDLIAEGVDCVIRGGTIKDDYLVARHLGKFEVITCATPCYLKRFGIPNSPEELNKHWAVNYFSARSGKPIPLDFLINGSLQNIDINSRISTNDSDTYQTMVMQGMGIGQLPMTTQVQDAISTGKLVQILKEWQPEDFPLYIVYPRTRYLSARVRVFIDWIIKLHSEIFNNLKLSP